LVLDSIDGSAIFVSEAAATPLRSWCVRGGAGNQ